MSELTIALSKGRLLQDSLPILERIGLAPASGLDGRKLRLPAAQAGVELLVIRATDVPAYVSHGAADLGIVGKDVLMEQGGDGMYEPLDLGIGGCRLCLAAVPGAWPVNRRRRPRIATKYPSITRSHFAARGEQVEIIKLYGSMELAPLVKLADAIVDLVDTGNTLRANGLEEVRTIADISARLVVNQASLKMKSARVRQVVEDFRGALHG